MSKPQSIWDVHHDIEQDNGNLLASGIAVPELQDPEANAVERHSPQENAAVRQANMGT